MQQSRPLQHVRPRSRSQHRIAGVSCFPGAARLPPLRFEVHSAQTSHHVPVCCVAALQPCVRIRPGFRAEPVARLRIARRVDQTGDVARVAQHEACWSRRAAACCDSRPSMASGGPSSAPVIKRSILHRAQIDRYARAPSAHPASAIRLCWKISEELLVQLARAGWSRRRSRRGCRISAAPCPSGSCWPSSSIPGRSAASRRTRWRGRRRAGCLWISDLRPAERQHRLGVEGADGRFAREVQQHDAERRGVDSLVSPLAAITHSIRVEMMPPAHIPTS